MQNVKSNNLIVAIKHRNAITAGGDSGFRGQKVLYFRKNVSNFLEKNIDAMNLGLFVQRFIDRQVYQTFFVLVVRVFVAKLVWCSLILPLVMGWIEYIANIDAVPRKWMWKNQIVADWEDFNVKFAAYS